MALAFYDKFHVAKHLGEAGDQVRRAENKDPQNKELQADDDDRLKGTRQFGLFNRSNLSWKQRRRFVAIRRNRLKTATMAHRGMGAACAAAMLLLIFGVDSA